MQTILVNLVPCSNYRRGRLVNQLVKLDANKCHFNKKGEIASTVIEVNEKANSIRLFDYLIGKF